jgi:DNA modification methylase
MKTKKKNPLVGVNCSYQKLVPVSQLVAHPANANKHPQRQIEMLAKIMKYQGWRHPIVVSKLSGFIVAGHGRLEAAKLNGWTEVPVDVQDFEDKIQETAFLYADNKIAELAEHDDELMKLGALELNLDTNGFDLDLLGVPDLDLSTPDEARDAIEDEVPEVKKSISKLGDLYELGEHRLLCGDSTDKATVEKLMGGERADLVHTYPPYGVEYDANWRNDAAEKGLIRYGTSKNLGKVKNDDKADWTEAYKNFGSDVIYVWHAGKFASLIQTNLESCGYSMVSQIIWAKPNFAISRGDYHWQHEPCWYAVKNGKKHNWQGARDQSTLWRINRDTEVNGHGTPKPVELNVKAIENSSAVGQVVADPFGGSGSTLIACEKTKRKCFMMELDPHYVDVIVSRYCKYTGKKEIKRNGEPMEWTI